MLYYVSQKNTAAGNGTKADPFQTISQAAHIAMPGDTVIIGDGIYREWVDPQNGGLGNSQRITYRNAEGAQPVISGAEPIQGWLPIDGTVWCASIPNSVFGGYNPYGDELFGDWYDSMGQAHHAGDLFVDGVAMYEAASLKALLAGPRSPEKALRWFAAVGQDYTVFYGDFGGKDPRTLCTEVSARPYCFFPRKEGVNYITVSGLTMRQSATQWAPPTAFQPGLIGPHWSKGWIIENCRIHDSKCSGISLGKKRDFRDNSWSRGAVKGGTQIYTEIIFSNLRDGWSKERIGGHIIRNNEIYNCGQTGIVGCMGGAFSDISGNHIHHINIRNEFTGAEVAGIKLHAAIDAVIERNVIHDCSRGLWLDWQAQGTYVRKNIFFRNEIAEDLFIEVCQGPCMVENNLLLSTCSLANVSQGTAYVHNLFAGKLYVQPDTSRFTFYHAPHSTTVSGMMLIYGGDDRILNNIFLGQTPESQRPGTYGTECYNGYRYVPAEPDISNDTPAAHMDQTLQMTVRDNVYLNGSKSWQHEQNAHVVHDFQAELTVTEEDGHYWLLTNLGSLPDLLLPDLLLADRITTAVLGSAFESEQAYENRDGSPLSVDSDLADRPRGEKTAIGPFESWSDKILLW